MMLSITLHLLSDHALFVPSSCYFQTKDKALTFIPAHSRLLYSYQFGRDSGFYCQRQLSLQTFPQIKAPESQIPLCHLPLFLSGLAMISIRKIRVLWKFSILNLRLELHDNRLTQELDCIHMVAKIASSFQEIQQIFDATMIFKLLKLQIATPSPSVTLECKYQLCCSS